ncbi:MAG TPA: hypothetical protein VFJ12_14290 [Segeticoccus sp.]|nr:hypothetical protein [Segeticoccus sp.]
MTSSVASVLGRPTTQVTHELSAAAAPQNPVSPGSALITSRLTAAANQATSDWQAVRPSEDLSALTFTSADLPGLELGVQAGSVVTVDVDAAGWGWSAMDLTTVLRHEIGHYLGLSHTASGLMAPTLAVGTSYPVPSTYATPPPATSASDDTTAPEPTAEPTAAATTEPSAEPTDTTAETTDTATAPPSAEPTGEPTDTSTAEPADTTADATDPPLAKPTTEPTTPDPTTPAEEPSPGANSDPTPADTTDSATAGSGSAATTSDTGTQKAASPDSGTQRLTAAPASADGTGADEVFTVVDEGGGNYAVEIGGTQVGTVSGAGTFTIDGGGGSDTLVSPDLPGVWTITGVDAGSYLITGGPTITFSRVENLTGADSAADEFHFDTGSGVSGVVADGSGELTVGVAGFVQVSGDYDFSRETSALHVATKTDTAGTSQDVTVLRIGGSSGQGFVGVTGLGSRVGVTGALSGFALAVVTSTDTTAPEGVQAWHVFSGTLDSPTFVAPADLDLNLHLDSLTVSVNTTSANGSWLNLDAVPLSVPTGAGTPIVLDFPGSLVSASAPVLLDLDGFLHVSGDVTLTKGGVRSVDVDTSLEGVDEADIPAALKDEATVPVKGSDDEAGGELARSDDFGKVWNLQVSTLQLAFTDANVFVGNGFGIDDANGNGLLDGTHEIASGAVGLFGGGVNLALLVLTPLGGMPLKKRFIGLVGKAQSVELIGIDGLTLSVHELAIEANTGPHIVQGAPSAAVDWVSSFPDPDTTDDSSGPGGTDPTPEGYHVFIGGTDPPELYVDSTGPVLGVSAEQVVLTVSEFVHLSGSFSLTQGTRRLVDVSTDGLDDPAAIVDAIGNTVTQAPDDDTELATTDDATTIWNLPVDTLLIGLGDADVFVGYSPGGFAGGQPSTDAVGLYATGIDVGLVLATAVHRGDAVDDLPAFLALRATIASLTPLGLPDGLDLHASGIELDVNRGGRVGSDTTSRAWIDWAGSFPAAGDGEPGLSVPSPSGSVLVDFTDAAIGIKADLVVVGISQFVYLAGGFSFELGGEETVALDVSGLTNTEWTTLKSKVSASSSDVTVGDTGRMLLDVPVSTILVGISDASVFVGYNPGTYGPNGTSFEVGGDQLLDRNDLSDGAFGLLASDIDAGFVLAKVKGSPLTGVKFASLFAMKARIAALDPVGLPEGFTLTASGIVLSVNSGGAVTLNGTPRDGSTATIDWVASFPGDDGGGTAAGLAVPTGTTAAPVYLDFDTSVVGISATRVLLNIDDFLYIAGGFAFTQGQVEYVDVDVTDLPGARSLATRINTANRSHCTVAGTPEDPGDEQLCATRNGSTIWNLPVVTTMIGITHASVFAGDNNGEPIPAVGSGDGGALTEDDLSSEAIGLLATDIRIAAVFASAEPTIVDGYGFSTFFAITATVGHLVPLGLPDELMIEVTGANVSVNGGGAVRTGVTNTSPGTKVTGSKAVVDWEASFPAEGTTPAGLRVETGEGSSPIHVDLHGSMIGISATRVVVAISDFVYLSGGFSFVKGQTEHVDVDTSGLLDGALLAGKINADNATVCGLGQDTDPGGTTLCATPNASTIWNVPVVTTMFGISDAALFVGYNPDAAGTEGTSFGDRAASCDTPDKDDQGVRLCDLSDGAIGLLANGIDVGLVFASVDPPVGMTVLRGLPRFWAIKASIGYLTPVGLPDTLVLTFEDIGLSVNKGGAFGAGTAWVDWAASFPADDTTDPTTPVGLEVPTGLGNPAVQIDFDDPVIAVSAGRVVIAISGFVFITGGFEFQQGGIETVSVLTGLDRFSDTGACTQLGLAATKAAAGGVSLSEDCSVLSGVQVQTIELGISDASIFVGYDPMPEGGTFDLDRGEVLTPDDIHEGAVGFLAGGINIGFVLAKLVPGALTRQLGKTPTFYTVKASVAHLALLGIPELVLRAQDATVEVNAGSKWTAAPAAKTGAAIDWTSVDGGSLSVATGGGNDPVTIDFDSYLIGGGVSHFVLSISDFVYLSGSFYFEYGPTHVMPLTHGLVDTDVLADLGLPTDLFGESFGAPCPEGVEDGTLCVKLRFLTLGAKDVHAFVGDGPYWFTDDDGAFIHTVDGAAPSDSNTCDPQTYAGQGTCEVAVNPDAVGLVIDDVDFALALMKPVNRANPMKFIALKASATQVALVGIDGLTASAQNINIELNISTPTVEGIPVLPVVDFESYGQLHPDDEGDPQYVQVKVGAPPGPGEQADAKTFRFDSVLIRAQGTLRLDVFGVLAVRGSIALVLGPTADVTLIGSATGDGTVADLTTMTLGGSHLMGFIGYDGPQWQLDENGNVIYTEHVAGEDQGTRCDPKTYAGTATCAVAINPDAVGFAITDLNLGVFIGTKVSVEQPAVYVAGNISVASFGVVGVDGFTALGTLALLLNLGLAIGQTTSLRGIDFSKSFTYDPDGEQEEAPSTGEANQCDEKGETSTADDPDCDDEPGYAVPTGDPENPIVLDFSETFVRAQLAGVLGIGDLVQALGVFSLEIGPEGLDVLVDAQLLVGPDMVENPDQGMVEGNHATRLTGDNEPLLQIGALGVLIINADGVAADLDVDLGFNIPGLSLEAAARLLFNTTGEVQQLEVPDRLFDFINAQANNGSDLAQNLLDRLVRCTDDATERRCYAVGSTAPDLTDQSTLDALLHDPTGTIKTIGDPGAYVVAVIEGKFSFLDFASGRGLAGIGISSGAFQLVFSLDFDIGIDGAGLQFSTSGEVELVDEGFSLDVGISLDADVTSLFHLDASGSLSIKTYGADAHFTLDLDGRLDILEIFTVDGSLFVHVQGGGWTVSVTAGGHFGPVDIDGKGTINSDGTFDLRFSAGFQLGPDVVHVSASIDLHIYMENTTAAGDTCNADFDEGCGVANGGNLAFGFFLGGGAHACALGVCVGVDIGVKLHGLLSGNPDKPSSLQVTIKACVDLLFDDACADIDVATIRLPGTIFTEPPPLLAEQVGDTLVLNVGDRGDRRNEQPDATVEDYQLVQLGQAADGSYTIQVIAFGRAEIFSGVTRVRGDFGSDDDSLLVRSGAFPVEADGGEGDDTLTSSASGAVDFDGGSGDDTLIGSSSVDSLAGGTGDDYLEGRAGTDTLVGGPDPVADGQSDDDIFYSSISDAFGESPTAGAGSDTMEIRGTAGADEFAVSTRDGLLVVSYTGADLSGELDLDAFEHVILRAGVGSDAFTVQGDLAAVGLQDLTLGLTELNALTEADTVTLTLTGAADAVRLTGGSTSQVLSLARGGGLATISYPAPTGGEVALTTVTWASGSVLRLVGTSAADADLFSVQALAGDDTVSVRGNSANTTIAAGAGDDRVSVGSNATSAGNSGGTLGGIDATLVVTGGAGSDVLSVDDTGDAGNSTGSLTRTSVTGLGMYADGISYVGIETLTIGLGTGADAFTIASTSSATTTTLSAHAGADTVGVQSLAGPTTVDLGRGADRITIGTLAPDTGGTLDRIAALLQVRGGDGSDTLTADDTGNASGGIGYLTSEEIAGLGMDIDPAHDPAAPAWSITVRNATGGDFRLRVDGTWTPAMAFDATAARVQDAVNDVLGAGAVTVSRSRADRGAGTTYLIRFRGMLTGAPPVLVVDFSGLDGQDATATLRTMSDGRISYDGIEILTIDLGSGEDLLDVDSTGATSTIAGGAGDDVLTVDTVADPTTVAGGAGADEVTVNALPDHPTTGNGLAARLTIDGGTGSDTVTVETFGNGDSRIDVTDTATGGDQNRLIVNGTGDDDTFLFRSGLVALLHQPVPAGQGQIQRGFAAAERVTYGAAMTAGLLVSGSTGDDLFALDDNSTATTIDGGAGADTVQVGQMYGDTVTFDGEFTPELTDTTHGMLTNGVSFEATVRGGEDDDTFFVFRNLAELHLFGDDGDDTFVIRTWRNEDEQSSVDGGAGADTYRYVQNAPVVIDGGDGFDTLVVIGTEADDTFVVTADSVTGAGRVVEFTGLEQVDVDGAAGNDTFIVVSTPAGVVVHVYGGLGSDTTIVGAVTDVVPGSTKTTDLLDGPLYVSGGDDPNGALTIIPAPVMLPRETSAPLVTTPNAAYDVIEAHQVDRLVVDDSDQTADTTGRLTGSQITGLGTSDDLVLDGRTIDGGITYDQVEALEIRLGSGADTFTVLGTHHGTTRILGNDGSDVVAVDEVSGHTAVSGGSGDDSFAVATGRVSGLEALLLLDGGVGTDTVGVDNRDATADQLATLTRHTLTGMGMVARSGLDRLYSVTVHQPAGTFTITLRGYGTVTLDVGATAGEMRSALQGLLFPDATSCGKATGGSTPGQDSRCAQSVFVWRHGQTYLVGFVGEVAGDAAPALTSSQTDLLRVDGIDYAGLERLDLAMGSGDDGVNVRGTTAESGIDTGAGDDLVFVSDSADLGNDPDALDAVDLGGLHAALAAADADVQALFAAILHGSLTIDDLTWTGSLDLVTGALHIDTGAGSNTLAVSDRSDADADRDITLTDAAITGLAPASITYTSTGGELAGQGRWTRVADSGLFGRGISVFLGSGGDRGTIASVRGGALPSDGFGATVTTVYAGAGSDTLTIAADAPRTGRARLVVLGQRGDDTLRADPAARQPLVLLGGPGADTLAGGSAPDEVFGDTGRVYHLAPGTSTAYDVVLGGAPVGTHLDDPRTGEPVLGDGDFLTVDVLRTAATGVGAADSLSGGGGNDLLLGGDGADTLHGNVGNDLAFGDYGWAGGSPGGYVDAATLPMSMPLEQHPFAFVSVDTADSHGGADAMHGDAGADILLGQQSGDTMSGGAGDDDLIGGHNVAGGPDGADTINGGAGADVIAGDNATVLRTGSTRTPLVRHLRGATLYVLDGEAGSFYTGTSLAAGPQPNPTDTETRLVRILDHTATTDPARYGDDAVEAGRGDDMVFGGLGDDTIRAGAGRDYVEAGGGDDSIHGGPGQDDLIGGSSDLFGLTDPAQRPDGSDTVYGGDGSGAVREDPGASGAAGHAADADVIVGDNGAIIAVVGDRGAFLSFTYDTSGAVIPRVVVLLDYSPAGEDASHWLVTDDPAAPTRAPGTGTNTGGPDFLHGEAGDDVIHGATGDDALFGDGQDDDLYGEAGQDWISGGTGTDGVVGDDGLVLTSRNGSTEPLSGVTTPTWQQRIKGNGPHHSAVVNVTGTLLKAVDLEPFGLGYDDVLYGGRGDDFLHGGEGNDAISGDEALPGYYVDDPWALLARYYDLDNLLGFGVDDPEKFLYYVPDDPRTLVRVCADTAHTDCLPFLVTNDPGEPDGADAVFGDGGNDWISGGTGADHLYGGWGNDLLGADDDLTSDTLNRSPDTPPSGQSYADYAFGGAGRDVLIANTMADRLIDWTGEFNSYLVPFKRYGAPTVWRAASPGVVRFLYALAAADGADQTRGTDHDSRHGEPFGELGLVTHRDAAWGDQHGAPDDPQPGNLGGATTVGSGPYQTFVNPTVVGTAEQPALQAPAGTRSGGTGSTSDGSSATATAGVAEVDLQRKNKVWTTLTVTLARPVLEDTTATVRVVDASGTSVAHVTLTVAAGDVRASTRLRLRSPAGTASRAMWQPSRDPTDSGLLLVRRVA